MTRIPRFLPGLVLAVSFASPALQAQDAPKPAPAPAPAPASDTPAPAPAPGTPAPAPGTPAPAPGAPAPATQPAGDTPAAPAALTDAQQNQPLTDDVDDFWHYGKIANYPLAVAFGNKILAAAAQPPDATKPNMLDTFELIADRHKDDLDDWMLRWEGVDAGGMKGVAIKIEEVLGKLRHERRLSQKWIQTNIEGLAVNERAYRRHLERLRESGELVVPMMLDYLKDTDPASVALKDPIRRALVDLGRQILNPLLAATETKDEDLQLTLITVLSQIGYDVATPYLSRIAQDRTHPGLADAANAALRRMEVRTLGNVADQFYRLSEKFYYNNASIQADLKAPAVYMWYWTGGEPQDPVKYKDVPPGNYPSARNGENKYTGLTYKEVPPAIFADLMSERDAEYALQLGPGTRDALSLWLCANNKAEVDMPEGGVNNAYDKDRPAANYYNVYAGAQYLNTALVRTLEDHNAPVALKLIKSLAQIVGPSSQGSGVRLDPLIAAMRYPDRQVRFEAAFALANSLPNNIFAGHERVAPLLAEAVSQTGTANILIVAPSQSDEQKYEADLKQYGLAGGTTANMAFNNALKLPAIDVIIFPETLGTAEIDQVYRLALTSPRFERAGKVIVTASRLSPWSQRVLSDPLTVVTQATDAAGLAAAIEEARKRTGGLPLDEKLATEYAVKAAQLLQRLAQGRVTAFDLTVTEPTLLAALNDKRPEVVKAVGEALAYMNNDLIQVGLLNVAIAEKTPDDVRVGLLQSLAKNTKFFGGHLAQTSLDDLQKQVDTNPTPEVRNAAAEARGALNLPAEQAKELIIKQAKR